MRHLFVPCEKPIFEFVVLFAGSFAGTSVDVCQLRHTRSSFGSILFKVVVPIGQKSFVHRAKPEFKLGSVQEKVEQVGLAEVDAQTG